jgi:hypothetical protein
VTCPQGRRNGRKSEASAKKDHEPSDAEMHLFHMQILNLTKVRLNNAAVTVLATGFYFTVQ